MSCEKRSITIYISNATTFPIYRHFHTLSHGYWRKIPPDVIASERPVQLIATPKFGRRRLFLKIQYSFVISNIEHIIGIELKLSNVTGNPCFKAFLATAVQRLYLPRISDLINCEWKQTSQHVPITYVVVILETAIGKVFFEKCRQSLRQAAKSLTSELKENGFSLFSRPSYFTMSKTNTRIPRHFLRNTKNAGWKVRLRDTFCGSVYLRISNLSQETLILHPLDTDDLHFSQGRWIEYPQETILPGCCAEAGMQCPGFFSTCRASVTYGKKGSDGKKPALQFSWEYGTRVYRASIQKRAWARLSVIKYVERGNEGSILFYVLDPHSLPRLELLVARVVDREAVDEAIARLPSSLKKCVALRQVVSKFSLAPVTTDFIRFLRETKAGKTVEPADSAENAFSRYACTELSILNAQMFLSATQTNVAPPSAFSELTVSQRCALYLEWQIGCQFFCNLWLPDERVWLYSGFPGGTTDLDVLFGSEVFHQECVPPSELLELSPAKELSTYSVESDNCHLCVADAPREQLFNGIVLAMQQLSSGLHTVVVSHMNRKYGKYWLTTECRVPRAHVWREGEGSELLLDLEGVIFVLVSRWDELFESIFQKAGLFFSDIKAIQNPCVCWSSQELSHFSKASVLEFMKQAHKMLQALNEKAYAADVDQLYRSFKQSFST